MRFQLDHLVVTPQQTPLRPRWSPTLQTETSASDDEVVVQVYAGLSGPINA